MSPIAIRPLPAPLPDAASLPPAAVREIVADEPDAYPCRRCLTDALPGERLLLLSYDPFTGDSPYRQPGPIFVHERDCAPDLDLTEVPEQLTRRRLSLRSFDTEHLMLGGEVVDGVGLEPPCERAPRGSESRVSARAQCWPGLLRRSRRSRRYRGVVSARLFWIGWLFHLKNLSNSMFFVLISVLQPVIFATIAFFMFASGQPTGTLLYAALGAGLMGIWSATLFGSGGAIQWQRWQGTLELLVAAPPPFLARSCPDARDRDDRALLGRRTLALGPHLLRHAARLRASAQFAFALPVTVLSLGALGLLLASTFILYRNANALLEPARVPGLARDRPARAALAAAELGRADRLGALADLGHAGDPRRGDRRQRLAGDRDVRRPRPRVPRPRLRLLRNFERLARSRATLSLT